MHSVVLGKGPARQKDQEADLFTILGHSAFPSRNVLKILGFYTGLLHLVRSRTLSFSKAINNTLKTLVL